ncbi:hypothetical protein GALL_220320 [mine drainage metagenome]|uniref:Uncharacterized protein n=1 Tax=mine drainage metagenome TaxID=410659 RepID=A0A1J5RJU2_9ZZZZ
MKEFILENDISVFCVPAQSFPEGVLEAHQKLHSIIPFSTERKYFGLSRPEKNVITYKAAAEELITGELNKHNLEKFVIRKGKYHSITIQNFMQNIPAIGKAFETILSHHDIDPNGICVEWYVNEKDVQCMVRIN